MRQQRVWLVGGICLGLLIGIRPAGGTIWRCPDATWGSIFQNEPCAGSAATALPPAEDLPPSQEPTASDPAALATPAGDTGFTPQQWEAICKSYGQAAYAIAQARDRGVPLSEVIEFVRRSNKDASPAVAKVFNDWYKGTGIFVYDNRWLRPQTVQQETEVACLKATAKFAP